MDPPTSLTTILTEALTFLHCEIEPAAADSASNQDWWYVEGNSNAYMVKATAV